MKAARGVAPLERSQAIESRRKTTGSPFAGGPVFICHEDGADARRQEQRGANRGVFVLIFAAPISSVQAVFSTAKLDINCFL